MQSLRLIFGRCQYLWVILHSKRRRSLFNPTTLRPSTSKLTKRWILPSYLFRTVLTDKCHPLLPYTINEDLEVLPESVILQVAPETASILHRGAASTTLSPVIAVKKRFAWGLLGCHTQSYLLELNPSTVALKYIYIPLYVSFSISVLTSGICSLKD